MGFDYAFVHLKYNVPPALVLSFLYAPLSTPLGLYKVLFLIIVAVVSTTPWDSYLIHSHIWSYPPNAVLGPTLFRIPMEEVLFFVIQTYNTSLLYLLLSKPTFHPVYIRGKKLLHDSKRIRQWRWIGSLGIMGTIVAGSILVAKGGHGLYLGLIIIWAGPFILLLWNLAYQFVIGLPISNTFIPIAIPTIYLWAVDTLALRRGTWTIESGTKLGLCLWEGLEIEEAIFFLLTNVLIILGLVAFDNAFAVLQTFPHIFPSLPSIPSPFLLVEALITSTQAYDERRIEALQQALARLKAKSRSFYLASSVFQGRLRVDLILLYSFCRVADDLIDEARSVEEAREWISKLRSYLDSRYDNGTRRKSNPLHDPIGIAFPAEAQAALRYLPTEYLSPAPLYDLLRGFETDLNFASSSAPFPIRDEDSLNEYGAQVAGTVAESCLELVYHHTQLQTQSSQKSRILEAGRQMGVALQYVNIARDIAVDAVNKRVYLPTSWLKEEDLLPESILSDPYQPTVERVRQRLLDRAMAIYEPAKSAIEELPAEARAPMRVAVESYVEIGRVLRTPNYRVKAGRATVPKLRRLRVAWKALGQ